MKKVLLFVVLAVLLTFGLVFAQGIQVIGSDQQNSAAETLDNIKEGEEYEIADWGIIHFIDYGQRDYTIKKEGYRDAESDGETGADYVRVFFKITNISLSPKNYLDKISVKAVYDDRYVINGSWAQWDDYDQQTSTGYYVRQNDVYPIDPFYAGFYSFGVTLPDYIINDTKPLRLEITIDDVELTYNIRK